MKSNFTHDKNSKGATKNEWLTPPGLIKSLGNFDLDPCAPTPETRPWDTALLHYDITQDGLKRSWFGRVFCNPPYDNKICGQFLAKCAEHGDAVVLIFARVETQNWFNHIWPKADAVLFLRGRLKFHHVDGTQAKTSAGAPSALIAYGKENAARLKNCGIEGKYIEL